jgi:hypothetical protein
MAAVQNPAKTLNSSVQEQTSTQASDKDANQHIAWLMSQEQAGDGGTHEYLLLFRFLLVNLLAFALVGAAYFQGLIDEIFIADRTHLTMVIVAVFVGGLAVCARKIWPARS